MKIRMQGNSIRLRLSQSEAEELAQTGKVEEQIQFGSLPQESLWYAMESADAPEMKAFFANGRIRVIAPKALLEQWFATDMVGMEQEMKLGEDKILRILVEKDFQCLTSGRGEDESDNFPNPRGDC